VKGEKLFRFIPQFSLISVSTLLLMPAAIVVSAQSSSPIAQPTPANTQSNQTNTQPDSVNIQPAPLFGPTVEDIQRRIERARALAAAHQLEAAATELESARATTSDIALHDVTSVLLMGIYLEAGNYSRAQSLLEETFQTRSAQKDSSLRTYFALAGQAVNGVRSHLARYRSLGVNLGSTVLPPEAVNDLDRARLMLERMLAQAKEITKDAPRASDGLALMEDVLGIRLSLARDSEDRERWQAEYARAREQLGFARMEIASNGGLSSAARPQQNPTQPAPAQGASANSKQGAPLQSASTDNSPQLPTIDAGLLNQRASKRVLPTYPALARTARTEGTVKVYVIISESGEVQVTNSEGPMLLRQAAEEAARAWRFSPAVVEGKPVRMSGYIEFNFGL
jgi:TonB family protein